MKNFVIKLVKKNPILYRGAKKVYRTFRPARPAVYQSNEWHLVCRIQDPARMPELKAQYDRCRNQDTRLVVLVQGHTLDLHGLVRSYPGVVFLSEDYYHKYEKQLQLSNVVLMTEGQSMEEIAELLWER